jgi:deoxyribose-phosphate aldolase
MLPINRYIDHAVLKPELTRAETISQIESGLQFNVCTVCVKPADIAIAKKILAGSDTEVSCVISFPHGNSLPAGKADEARRCIAAGAAELDMVVNYGLIRSGLWDELREDISAVTAVAKPAGVKVKTIFETACLTLEEIAKATEIAVECRADFVKTSTGFGPGGATEQAVRTMLKASAGRIGVKASGGIRDFAMAEMYLKLGATRLGIGATTTPIICNAAGKSLENY